SSTKSSFKGKNVGKVNNCSKSGFGFSKVTTNVWSSSASTPNSSGSFSSSNISCAFSTLAVTNISAYCPTSSNVRFHAYSKSCAVTGSPLDHSASSRSVNVCTVSSSLTSTSSAKAGCGS